MELWLLWGHESPHFRSQTRKFAHFEARHGKVCYISFLEPGSSLHCGCRCKYVNWCFIRCMLKPHPLSYLCSLQYRLRTYDYHNFFRSGDLYPFMSFVLKIAGATFDLSLYWHQYPWVLGEPICKLRAFLSEM